MSEPIKQDFAAAAAAQKRLIFNIGVAFVVMFALVQGVALFKLGRIDIPLMVVGVGAIACTWWIHTRSKIAFRQLMRTEWQASDRGLEWTDASGDNGVFLWDEILAMVQIGERLQLRCRKAEAGSMGVKFSLYVGKERGAQLQAMWESRRTKPAR